MRLLTVRCLSVNMSKNSANMYSMFRRGVNFLFKKNLLITNSVSSGGFMAIGDLVQQEFEFQSNVLLKRYDWPSDFPFYSPACHVLGHTFFKDFYAFLSLAISNLMGPVILIIITLHCIILLKYIMNQLLHILNFSGRMFIVGTIMGPMHHYYYVYLDKVLPKADLKTVFKKIVYDQLIASPATILCFFYGMGILESKSFTQSTAEIKQKFRYVYTGDCLYWPPVQFVNFYYLPTQYRVFYINAATMIFNIFLSYMKHYDQH